MRDDDGGAIYSGDGIKVPTLRSRTAEVSNDVGNVIHTDPKRAVPRMLILEEREREYGSFTDIANLSVGFKSLVVKVKPRESQEIPSTIIEAIGMICTKLARVVYNPSHKDSWKDIAGYANLVVEYLESK